jgi:hypothetical protein
VGELASVRGRLEQLRRSGRKPRSAVMSPMTWETIVAEYVAELGAQSDAAPTGRDVLGVFTTRFAGATGVAIWHDGGVDKAA